MNRVKPIYKDERLRLMIIVPNNDVVSQTFIRAHIEQLPFQVIVRYGTQTALCDSIGRKIWFWGWWFREAACRLSPIFNETISTFLLVRHLKTIRADAVLAEFGTSGSWIAPACAKAKIPLFVHFHGYDAWRTNFVNAHRTPYRQMFNIASGVVAVSEPMREQLLCLGAKPEQVRLNPCGVDPDLFFGAYPGKQPPHFLAIGRFVEKKAPYLTILAFSQIISFMPNAKLTMVGDGPLIGPCKRLAAALGVQKVVIFVGEKTPSQIINLMRKSRCFVQHSLRAEDGDCEGTPVAIIEAQMSGLPVVSTRHAGIPKVVIENETGFLVNEGDTQGMADAMLKLAKSPELASKLGAAGREWAISNFTLKRHLEDLSQMIQNAFLTSTPQA